jgi:hypothetical protein
MVVDVFAIVADLQFRGAQSFSDSHGGEEQAIALVIDVISDFLALNADRLVRSFRILLLPINLRHYAS